MPQMMPLNWLIIFLMILMLLLTIYINFSFVYLMTVNTKFLNKNNKILMMKW